MFETDSKRCRQLQQLLRFGQDISRTQSRTDSASCRSNCKLSGSHVSPVFSCQINSWHCRFADQEWRWQLSDGIPARQLLSNRPLKEQVTNYEDLRSSNISNNLAHSKSAEIILYNHLTKYAEMNNWSRFHWLILVLLYALFVQWSMFPLANIFKRLKSNCYL